MFQDISRKYILDMFIAADLPPAISKFNIILGNMKKEHPETDVEKNSKML